MPNRHRAEPGSPAMPFRRVAPPLTPVEFCVWPGCDDQPSYRDLDLSFPLCSRHAHQAANICMIHRDRLASSERAIRRRVEREARNPRAKPSSIGWIYYLRVGERVKIGHSNNIIQRLASYPPDSVLLALHPGSRSDEQNLHRHFSVLKRLGREWYAPHAAIDVQVGEVLAKYGPPQKMLTELREHETAMEMIRPT